MSAENQNQKCTHHNLTELHVTEKRLVSKTALTKLHNTTTHSTPRSCLCSMRLANSQVCYTNKCGSPKKSCVIPSLSHMVLACPHPIFTVACFFSHAIGHLCILAMSFLPFWQYHLGKSDMVAPYVRYVRFQDPNWHPKRNWSTFSSHGEYCSYWFIPNAMVDLHQSLPKPCQKHSRGWGLAGSAAKRMVPSRISHSKIKASE